MILIQQGGKMVKSSSLRKDPQIHNIRIGAKNREIPNTPDRKARIAALKRHYSEPEQVALLEASA